MTLPDLVRRNAAERPTKVALVGASAYGGDELVRVTYGDLATRVHRFAAALRAVGVAHGDRVALLFDNTTFIEAIISLYGGHEAGAIGVPINARSAGLEVMQLLDHCDARILIGSSAVVDRVWPSIEGGCRDRIVVIAGQSAIRGHAMDWHQIQLDAPEPTPIDIRPTDNADWLFTSGTTGDPKCAMSTHQACVATGLLFASAFGVIEDDVLHSTFPFYSSASCHAIALSALWSGATYIAEPAVDVHRVTARIAEERCTCLYIPAAVWNYVFDADALQGIDVSSVRLVRVGGAPLPTSLIDRLLTAFPDAELYNAYGMTESGNAGLTLNLREHPSHGASIGTEAMPGMGFRLVTPSGMDAGVGEVGEILLRGPCLMTGYYKDPAATAAALRDGWLFTGDLATRDADGFVHIYDRKKDVIIRGGFNISSVQVEDVLRSHPEVIEAAVVPKPHPRLGEDVRAFVVLAAGSDVSSAELTSHCAERLADFKVPRDIVIVETLPRTATGKVQKNLLRAMEPTIPPEKSVRT